MKQFVETHPKTIRLLIQIINHIPFLNSIHLGKSNLLKNEGLLKNTKIRVKGKNNQIIIGKNSRLIDCNIFISGDHNKIIIGEWCHLKETEFYIEDNTGNIIIDKKTSICGKTHLACIEGKSINIGEGCLISSDVTVRTGDSHSVLDVYTKKRINSSEDVSVGDFVWLGNQVILLKGVKIGDNSIVGSGSVVTKSFEQANIVVAGNPAKIVKKNINWRSERIETSDNLRDI